MELKNFSNDLQELTSFEYNNTEGGVSLWYHVGYAIGAVVGAFVNGVRPLDGSQM